jgi:hypothetical protein
LLQTGFLLVENTKLLVDNWVQEGISDGTIVKRMDYMMQYNDLESINKSADCTKAISDGIMDAIGFKIGHKSLRFNTQEQLRETALPKALESWCEVTGNTFSPFRVSSEKVCASPLRCLFARK